MERAVKSQIMTGTYNFGFRMPRDKMQGEMLVRIIVLYLFLILN